MEIFNKQKSKKKESKIKIILKPKYKYSYVYPNLLSPRFSIKNRFLLNKTQIINKNDNNDDNKIIKKIESKKSFFFNSEKEVLNKINKVNKDIIELELNEKSENEIKNLNNKIINSKSAEKLNSNNNNSEKETISINYENNSHNIQNLKLMKPNIINGIINTNSTLGKVYIKCIKNIQLGEKVLKYMDDKKLKTDIENKIKDEK